MSAIEVKSAAVSFPINAADTKGLTGVHRITGVTAGTAGSVLVPVDLRGKFVRVRPIGSDIQVGVSYGTAGQTLTASPASALGTGAAASGATIKDGEFLDGLIPTGLPNVTGCYFNYINSGSTTCTIELWCSEAVKP